MTNLADSTEPVITVRKGAAADVIATIWYRLGYRPSDSLVLVGLNGPQERLGLSVRADLPARAGRAAREQLVTSLLAPVLADSCDAVLAVVFSERLLGGHRSPLPVGALTGPVAAARVDLLDVIGVTATHFRSLMCRSARCCPRGGFPISDVENSAAAAAHVLAGYAVMAHESDLIGDVRPVFPASEHAALENAATSSPGPAQGGVDRLAAWRRWSGALAEGDGLGDGPFAARLAGDLTDPVVRDAVLLAALGVDPGQVEAVLHEQVAAERPVLGAGAAATFEAALRRPADAGEAHACALDATVRVVAAAARNGSAEGRGCALAVLAMISWYRNEPVRARLLVDASLQVAPVSGPRSLAWLVADLLLSCTPPPWLAQASGDRGSP